MQTSLNRHTLFFFFFFFMAAAAMNAAAKAGGRGTARQGGGGKSSSRVREGDELTCKVCGMAYPSRNQLFKHIQQTGHAAFK